MKEKFKQFKQVVRIEPEKKFEDWKFSVFKQKKNTLILRLKPESPSRPESKQVKNGIILLPEAKTPLMILFFPNEYNSYKEAEYLYTLQIENTKIYKILIPEKNKIQREEYTSMIKEESFGKHMNSGKKYLEKEEFDKAEINFIKATEDDKKAWDAWCCLAETQLKLKQLDKASASIGKVKPLKENEEVEELQKRISDAIEKEKEKEITKYINQINEIFENQITLLKSNKENADKPIKSEIRVIAEKCLKDYPDNREEIIQRIKVIKKKYTQEVENYRKRKEKKGKTPEKHEKPELVVKSITIKPIGEKTLKDIIRIPDEERSYEEILYEDIIVEPEEKGDSLTGIRILKQRQKILKQREKILKQRQELTKSIRAVINKIRGKVDKRIENHVGLNKKTGALWKAILWRIESKHGIWETSIIAQNISKACETIRNNIEKLEKIREEEGLNGKRKNIEEEVRKTTKKKSEMIQKKIKETRRIQEEKKRIQEETSRIQEKKQKIKEETRRKEIEKEKEEKEEEEDKKWKEEIDEFYNEYMSDNKKTK